MLKYKNSKEHPIFFCYAWYSFLYKYNVYKIAKRLNKMLWKRLYYMVHSISFQSFFVQAFKLVVDSWKFPMLLLYILWDDWPIFMISASNE